MLTDGAVNRDNSVLDFCRLHDMTIQAWSPFQYGFFEGVFVDSEKYPELNRCWRILRKNMGQQRLVSHLHGYSDSGKDSDGSRYDQSEAIAGDRAGGRYPADQEKNGISYI